jgi:hypothetical protein
MACKIKTKKPKNHKKTKKTKKPKFFLKKTMVFNSPGFMTVPPTSAEADEFDLTLANKDCPIFGQQYVSG